MPLPQGPLPAGTKVRISVEVEVVADHGDSVSVRIPDGYGEMRPSLIPRAALDGGEVVGG